MNSQYNNDSSGYLQQLREEQNFVDKAYRILDRQLKAYRREQAIVSAEISANPSARADRDALAAHYGDAAAQLESVENRLVFGRLDMKDSISGEHSYHIGRLGLREEISPPNENPTSSASPPKNTANSIHNDEVSDLPEDPISHQVLLDWRAPAARPFYQATALNNLGVRRRRHITTELRQVVSVEDELLDFSAATQQTSLQGEGALLAALSSARSGHMSDIVSTIQNEQDRIIRKEPETFLVVQGGPGTGKTAVALHRAAYLLYAYRERLDSKGVLVVGPNQTFLRYIERVLPALGETGVVSLTIGESFPGLTTIKEKPALVELKGSTRWIQVCRKAVADLRRPPHTDQELQLDHVTLQLPAKLVQEAMEAGSHAGSTHNQRWAAYAKYLVRELTKIYAGLSPNSEDSEWISEEIRSSAIVRRAINRMYLPASPTSLLERLYAHPQYLRKISSEVFSPQELDSLYRPKGSPFTDSDVPILDELAELLGALPDVTDSAARRRVRERQEISRAAEAIESMQLGGGLVNSRMLANQYRGENSLSPLAERARGDRTWVYGHVVVDEAQELTPMDWHLLLRRCPSRSFTVVGDVNQSSRLSHATWQDLLGPAARVNPVMETLTVNYRTPKQIMDLAQGVLNAHDLPVLEPLRSARVVDNCLEITRISRPGTVLLEDSGQKTYFVEMLKHILASEIAHLEQRVGAGQGKLAVISSLGKSLSAALGLELNDPVEDQQCFLSPEGSKGLEFDSVILVDPTTIARESVGNLYVAMTRPTQRLRVVAWGELPPGMV